MSSPTIARKSLNIGRVVQDGVSVLARNIAPFGLMSLVLSGLPTLVFGLAETSAKRPGSVTPAVIGAWLLGAAGASLLYGALIYGLARRLEGRQATLAECLSMGRRRWGALFGLVLVKTMLTGVGLVLLVVPGVLLLTRWSVATPALVLEKRGIRDAMRRSAQLTNGRRWSIFLLYAIFLTIFLLGYLTALVLSGYFSPGGGSFARYYLIWNPLLSTFSGPLMVAIFTALFVRLRGDKEGGAPDALAEVFA